MKTSRRLDIRLVSDMFMFVLVMTMLNIGDKAPDFELKDSNGEIVKLSDFRGKIVVLYFYPKDDTPGCTKEACNLRDNRPKLKNMMILGVSMDSIESHKKFSDKYSLTFPLLSDEKGDVCRKYGAYGEKNFLGKKYMGIRRMTFIIDEKGTIKNIFEKVDTGHHAEQIMEKM